ncbi:MAG: alpha/beta hydrolase [Thermoanaerobaculia bacterium]|nr:alpha/beta hydrolase [Thermoanaerobaculia bacterium]
MPIQITIRSVSLVLALVLFASAASAARLRPVRRPAPGLQPPFEVTVARDVEYCRTGSRALLAHAVDPVTGAGSAPRPAIIWVHGGGWRSGTRDQGLVRVEPLARRGWFGLTIEYRLSDEATFPAQIEDVKCAVRYLRANAAQLNVDPDRIAMWGASAGGHLVALTGVSADRPELEGVGSWLGVSSRVQAVVDWYGPSDLPNMESQGLPCAGDHSSASSPEGLMLGCALASCPDKARAASPISYVSADDPPMLIQHGTDDCVVPPLQSSTFAAALTAAGATATLEPMPGAGHGGPEFVRNANLERIYRFLDETLKPE